MSRAGRPVMEMILRGPRAGGNLVPATGGDKKKENGKWQKGIVAGKSSEESDIFKMVKMIIQRQYDPVILFSFSKRECEFLAMQVVNLDNRNIL